MEEETGAQDGAEGKGWAVQRAWRRMGGTRRKGMMRRKQGSVELSCTEQGVPVQRQTREADEGGAAGGPERVGMPGWRPADVLRTKCPGRMDGVAVRRRGRLAVEKTGKTVK